MKKLILIAVVMALFVCQAVQADPASTTHHGLVLTVDSYTDGFGYFSYTFTRGSEEAMFGGESGSGGITIKAYGVQNVFDPAGWQSTQSTLYAENSLQWQYVGPGEWFIDDNPIVFAYQSSITQFGVYDDGFAGSNSAFPMGIVVGDIYDLNYYPAGPVGFESFEHFGPIPEPSSMALIGIGLLVLMKRK